MALQQHIAGDANLVSGQILISTTTFKDMLHCHMVLGAHKWLSETALTVHKGLHSTQACSTQLQISTVSECFLQAPAKKHNGQPGSRSQATAETQSAMNLH